MKSQYVLPITIVVAGVLIAGAVFLVGQKSGTTPTPGNGAVSIRPYTPGVDHILGNPDAEIKVVEYMDLECPHCKIFNNTMHQIMDYYGASGKVAWVQRPLPLAQSHSKAPKEAHAAECAAEQGGDTAYFAYTDAIFEITPSDNGLDLAVLPQLAQQIGLNVDTFNKCMSDNKFAEKITASYNEAIKGGAQGTPYTLLMVGTESVVLNGAQPYDSMRAAIDAVLQEPITPPTTTPSTSTTSQQ
jgi:protein-disulfide isomerase